MPYLDGESRVEAVDRTLRAREEAINILKFHLQRSQNRMKQQADKNRTERSFEQNDWVLLKLQPHRQVTIRQGKQNKFSPKYYGPFKVIEKVGEVAYKLSLPAESQIHNVFHVSQLKKCRGIVQDDQPVVLPHCDGSGMLVIPPIAVLDRKMVKKNNVVAVYGLIQWTNGDKWR